MIYTHEHEGKSCNATASKQSAILHSTKARVTPSQLL